MTAYFVQNYLVYLQASLSQALQDVGLESNICDQTISSDLMPNRPPLLTGLTKHGISGLLDITAPGTALDTICGKYILAYLHSLSGKELCTPFNAYYAYVACTLSSDDSSEKEKFNILQFASGMLPITYHGTNCNRLEHFTSCWNLLQQLCGHKARGLEQHATLLVEGCKIQSELDTVGCHWQDMLLPHYIQASRVTVWPMVFQCLGDPMYLDDSHYGSYSNVVADLDTAISLLQPGVDEISRKCGSQSAKRIRLLLKQSLVSTTIH